MTTPPPGSWQAQNPHLADPTPAQVAWQEGQTGATYPGGKPLSKVLRDQRARQRAWRRRWMPVLLVLAVIFGALSFAMFVAARP